MPVVLRLAKRVVDADLSAPCDALVLFPESGGNMHRFAAATACAVLDVLGPPYSGDRDCTYYQDLPYRHHHHDDDAGSKYNATTSCCCCSYLISSQTSSSSI